VARNRSLSPDIFTDEKVMQLPYAAVTTYIGLISQSDDEGRLEWRVTQLAARIAGFRSDITINEFTKHLEAIQAVGLIVTYSVDGRLFAYHPAWFKHQYVNRRTASKLPLPHGEEHQKYILSRSIHIKIPTKVDSITDTSLQTHGDISESHVPSDSDSDSESDSDSKSGKDDEREPAQGPDNNDEAQVAAQSQARAEADEIDAKVKAMLDHVGPQIKPLLATMTLTDWRKKNAQAARSLVLARVQPHEVVAFWARHRDREGKQLFMLSALQTSMQTASMPKSQIAITGRQATQGDIERGWAHGLPVAKPRLSGVLGFTNMRPKSVTVDEAVAWVHHGVIPQQFANLQVPA
jgi:hypothetical protein